MKNHTSSEYKQNELDMLVLFRKLSWREQLMLIGRMEVMAERGTVIQFPAEAAKVRRGCMV